MKATAILADDEPLIVKGLGKLIPWQELGIEIVALAYDGRQLMDLIREHKPDIIVSDICMPHVTGIEMIKEVKRLQLSSQVIFISAFQEFTYARDAVAYGAVDYLVKPVKKPELENVLLKALSLIREQSEEDRMRSKLSMLETKNRNDEFDEGLMQLAAGTLSVQSQAYERLCMRLPGPNYTAGIVGIDPIGNDFSRWPAETRKLVEFAIHNILNECVSERRAGSAFVWEGRHVLILAHEARESPLSLCDDIRQQIEQCLKLKVSIGLGLPVRELIDLQASYRQAIEAIEMSYFQGMNRIRVHAIPDRKRDSENEWFAYQSGVIRALTEGDWKKALSGIDGLLRVIQAATVGNRKLAVSTCFTAVVSIVQEVKKTDVPMSAWGFDIQHLQGTLERYETYDALCEGVIDMLQALFNRIGDKIDRKEDTLISRVVDYIHLHYSDEITLESAAAVAFMNPYYFSSFFKKHMKCNFKQYVTDLRMEKAMELLNNTDLMIYEIAERVGYNNARHFSDMFKKHTGKLPQEVKQSRKE